MKPNNWKDKLKQFEIQQDWDSAMEFMQDIIKKNPEDLQAYLSIDYLLMNLLVEEDYDKNKHDYYAKLAKKYFDESYLKFSNDSQYLYYTGRTACMSEWYFGIDIEEADQMMEKAERLDSENLVYKWNYYYYLLDSTKLENKEQIVQYAKLILMEDSSIVKTLKTKGSLGEYILDMMTHWAMRVLNIK